MSQSLYYDVIPGVGAGPFKIGMKRDEIIISLQDIDENINIQNIEYIKTDNFCFTFTKEGIVSGISFEKDFKGKIFGKVGFGDPVDILLPAEDYYDVCGFNPNIKGLLFIYGTEGLSWMDVVSAERDLAKEARDERIAYFESLHEDEDEIPMIKGIHPQGSIKTLKIKVMLKTLLNYFK